MTTHPAMAHSANARLVSARPRPARSRPTRASLPTSGSLALALVVGLLLAVPGGSAQVSPATPPAPTIAQGQQLLQQQKFAEAAAVFEALTVSQPGSGQAWFLLGYARHGAGDLDGALVGHLKAVELKFNVALAAYNAGCAHALLGDVDLAMGSLEQAWRAGFANAETMSADTDLTSLAADPRFVALLVTMCQTASPQPLALGDISTLGDAMLGIGGGMVVGADGSLFVADFFDKIYKVQPDGTSEVFADGLQIPAGIALDSRGRIVQSSFWSDRVLRFSPSGEEREVIATGIPGPVGIVIDEDDRIYVTSCQSASLYVIEPDGTSRRLAQSNLFKCPNGITRDQNGNLYVCNYNDGMVLRVDTEGVVTPLVSIPGANNGHITYRHGALWVAGMTANQLFRVDLDGTLSLIAGTGAAGGADGAALQGTLFKPNAMAFDPSGTTLYWNDQRGYLGDAASQKASIVRSLTLEP